jgi:hypothetical protein
MGKMLCKISVLLMAVLLSASWSFGQSTFGGIVGVVKDPSQSAVASAELALKNLDDHTERKADTDANGGFEFINLKAGRYELVVHANGVSGRTRLREDGNGKARLAVC